MCSSLLDQIDVKVGRAVEDCEQMRHLGDLVNQWRKCNIELQKSWLIQNCIFSLFIYLSRAGKSKLPNVWDPLDTVTGHEDNHNEDADVGKLDVDVVEDSL